MKSLVVAHLRTAFGGATRRAFALLVLGLLAAALGGCSSDPAQIAGADVTGGVGSEPTNGNSDCAAVSGCLTYQEFNGSRPPQ
jgi:hypothetical protein